MNPELNHTGKQAIYCEGQTFQGKVLIAQHSTNTEWGWESFLLEPLVDIGDIRARKKFKVDRLLNCDDQYNWTLTIDI
ncbi:hypothetical protein ACFL3T_03850 [Patescibacteria group bacterium]